MKYAVGEIILVVIGIVIAFQINNYRDNRKSDKRLKDIVKIVVEDLKNDTTEVGLIVKYYERRDTLFQRIIDKKVTRSEYDSVLDYIHLIFTYAPVSLDRTGFDLLRQHESIISLSSDSALIQTIQFYSLFSKGLSNAEQFVRNDVESNLDHYKKNFPWFYQRALNDKTKFIKHIETDPYFMNRIVMHHRLVMNNYMLHLKLFNKEAALLLPKLKSIL